MQLVDTSLDHVSVTSHVDASACSRIRNPSRARFLLLEISESRCKGGSRRRSGIIANYAGGTTPQSYPYHNGVVSSPATIASYIKTFLFFSIELALCTRRQTVKVEDERVVNFLSRSKKRPISEWVPVIYASYPDLLFARKEKDSRTGDPTNMH